MRLAVAPIPHPAYLGIDGGATRTVALVVDAPASVRTRIVAGPANVRLLSDPQLRDLFHAVSQQAGPVNAIGIGLAGARTNPDLERIHHAARRFWPTLPTIVTHDLETALRAAPEHQTCPVRVLVLSGTGSCCYGRTTSGQTLRVGGWGHLLGDRGSAFDLASRALRAVVALLDRTGGWPPLGGRLLAQLQLNDPEQLIDWVQTATKDRVAALAPVVLRAGHAGDRLARTLVRETMCVLTTDALACADQLASPTEPVHFILAGGLLVNEPRLAQAVARCLRAAGRPALVTTLHREPAWGAVALARQALATAEINGTPIASKAFTRRRTPPELNPQKPACAPAPANDLAGLSASPTERRNPRSMRLDGISTLAAVDLLLSEERRVAGGLRHVRLALARAIDMVAPALRNGGRLFYVGAGTSGRLGILDASECPPTFGTSPDLVQGIIAGGPTALWASVEGAEDDAEAGARAIAARGATRRDIVFGIAASGRTPFVWGALREAKRRGGRTILLTFNPRVTAAPGETADLVIAADVGPELLTGSTRLKAGTATKLVLNMISTLTMVRLGKVISNLMVDLNATNRKLRDRAARIVCQLTGVESSAALCELKAARWNVRNAVRRLQRRNPAQKGSSARTRRVARKSGSVARPPRSGK